VIDIVGDLPLQLEVAPISIHSTALVELHGRSSGPRLDTMAGEPGARPSTTLIGVRIEKCCCGIRCPMEKSYHTERSLKKKESGQKRQFREISVLTSNRERPFTRQPTVHDGVALLSDDTSRTGEAMRLLRFQLPRPDARLVIFRGCVFVRVEKGCFPILSSAYAWRNDHQYWLGRGRNHEMKSSCTHTCL
jgi:hypothetical protein